MVQKPSSNRLVHEGMYWLTWASGMAQSRCFIHFSFPVSVLLSSTWLHSQAASPQILSTFCQLGFPMEKGTAKTWMTSHCPHLSHLPAWINFSCQGQAGPPSLGFQLPPDWVGRESPKGNQDTLTRKVGTDRRLLCRQKRVGPSQPRLEIKTNKK